MMLYTYELKTDRREQFIDITPEIKEAAAQSGIGSGICIVYVPHTTAGVTINENADPAVIYDIEHKLEKLIPYSSPEFKHAEGNSASHIKASITGNSATVIIEDKKVVLGTWQSVFFREFDGPRRRKFYIKVIEG